MPDIIYSRPENRKEYISIAKHQSKARNDYSKWISMKIEKKVFDYSDYGNFECNEGFKSWQSADGNAWGLKPDCSEVGTKKQQFGFFQAPANNDGEWHGFPIVPFSEKRYCISDDLLKRWVNEGVISEDDIPAIMKKKRI